MHTPKIPLDGYGQLDLLIITEELPFTGLDHQAILPNILCHRVGERGC